MKHFDLFSGIGGFALAARWAGFETIGLSEIDNFCCKVLAKNFPGVLNYGDIRNISNLPRIDLMTGGFPCQPFSVAGKQKGIHDERYLWPEFYRVIKLSKPNWIVIENVPGILYHIDTIIKDLENQEYACWPLLIPASLIGATHKRERLWLIAYSNSRRCNDGEYIGKGRHLQDDWQSNLETLQQEWSQLIPKSWSTFNAQDWFHGTNAYCEEDEPPVPRVDVGLPNIVDRNRALGNSIVPQVVFPILRWIYALHQS